MPADAGTPPNDPTIDDECLILRRVPTGWHDPEDGIPDSGNFKMDPIDDAISVTLWNSPADLENTLALKPAFGLISLPVGVARQFGLGIVRDPVGDNPNHCCLKGKIGKSARQKLASSASWVKLPDAVSGKLKSLTELTG